MFIRFQYSNTMAIKLLVALGCLALCHSNPVFVNDYIFRDGRGYAIGQAETNGYSGQATGSASVNNEGANAFSSASSDNQRGQNIDYREAFLRQAIANAEVYDTPQYGSANAVVQAQNMPTYYNVPAAATVVSYEQSFEVPNEYGVNRAESSSIYNGNSDSSITSAKTEGLGYAQANGIGSFGIISSNTNSFGPGSASSNSNNIYGIGMTATKTRGFGSAYSLSQNNLGSALSNSQSSGGESSASSFNSLDSSKATANTQGFGSASSNVYPRNPGNAGISHNTKGQKKIGWHIGTSYNIPSSNRVQAASQSYGGSAKSNAYKNRYGNAQTSANTQGYASASSNSGNGKRYTNSAANSNGFGTAKSSAAQNNYGSLNSHASSSGLGSAQSSAGHGSNYQVNGSSRFGYPHRSSTNAQTAGLGSASSAVRTQGVNASYRVADSNANSYGSGVAQANSYSQK